MSVNLGRVVGFDGKSAYEIALDNGFVGTEQEYLASLKGEKGDIGEKGEKGDIGEKGVQGQAGQGVPSGGGVGKALFKSSIEDFATEWKEVTADDIEETPTRKWLKATETFAENTIAFDSMKGSIFYGTPNVPITGDLTLSATNAKVGATVWIYHRQETAPNIEFGDLQLAGDVIGAYVEESPAALNAILITFTGGGYVAVAYRANVASFTPTLLEGNAKKVVAVNEAADNLQYADMIWDATTKEFRIGRTAATDATLGVQGENTLGNKFAQRWYDSNGAVLMQLANNGVFTLNWAGAALVDTVTQGTGSLRIQRQISRFFGNNLNTGNRPELFAGYQEGTYNFNNGHIQERAVGKTTQTALPGSGYTTAAVALNLSQLIGAGARDFEGVTKPVTHFQTSGNANAGLAWNNGTLQIFGYRYRWNYASPNNTSSAKIHHFGFVFDLDVNLNTKSTNPEHNIAFWAKQAAGLTVKQYYAFKGGGIFAPDLSDFIYADNAAADADTELPSGAFYKLTGDRAIYQKP